MAEAVAQEGVHIACGLAKLEAYMRAEADGAQSQLAARTASVEERRAKRTCNRHDDCDAADAKARADGRLGAEHCHDEDCEDCFGS